MNDSNEIAIGLKKDMMYVMPNDLPVLNNYRVFMSPGYMMEEIIVCLFSFFHLTVKLFTIQLNH